RCASAASVLCWQTASTSEESLCRPGLVFDLSPVACEFKVGAVYFCVALNTPDWCRHEAVALCRSRGVLPPRPVTCFALHVCELGPRVQQFKSAFLVGDVVTSAALVVELFALAPERGHGVCVPALCPDVARFGVTSRTRLRPDVRRVPRAKQVWLCRSRFGALALLVCKVG